MLISNLGDGNKGLGFEVLTPFLASESTELEIKIVSEIYVVESPDYW